MGLPFLFVGFGASATEIVGALMPAEMFAEGRARCLGYGADADFGEMSCDDIDSLIAGTEMADQIFDMSNSGF